MIFLTPFYSCKLFRRNVLLEFIELLVFQGFYNSNFHSISSYDSNIPLFTLDPLTLCFNLQKNPVDRERRECYSPNSKNWRFYNMASDELRIILEDVKEKFDLVIEAVNMTNERLDRNQKANEERFDKIETEILVIKKDIGGMKGDIQGMKGDIQGMQGDIQELRSDIQEIRGDIQQIRGDIQEIRGDIRDLRQDLNDHRSNTELHGRIVSTKVS